MDQIGELHEALGVELLRAKLLGQPPPKLADRYVIEDVLGRGASGLVLAAVDALVGLPVALKVRPAVPGDSSMPDEARALLQLDHRNVVRVRGIDLIPASVNGRDFRLWLVSMERLHGQTMRSWLRERRRRPREILGVLADVGRGLAAAHKKRIVHRDVKPDNVFVLPDGTAQVFDFGFAVQASSTFSELGAIRGAAGTDAYMAPEARLGKATRGSDQYSLGVTMVEAFTDTAIPAGARVPRGVPDRAWAVAQRATQPNPDDRFASMDAMVDDLAQLARPPSRRPLLLAVGAMLMFVAVAWATPRYGCVRVHRPTVAAHEASPDSSDATAQTIAEPPAPASNLADAAAPTGRDTATDEAGARPTPACTPRPGAYPFRTEWTHGWRPPVTQGTYELGVASRSGRVELRLSRTAPGRDHLWVRSFDYVDDCVLHVSAAAEHRGYEFWLQLDHADVKGRFETSGDHAFGGTVAPLR